MTHKRKNYLEWEEYFMAIAFLSAQRSKDPSTQVGACIVNQGNKVVGIGYNGMPIGCSDDAMPWNKAADASQEKWLRSKLPYVCHAELNAVMNKNSADLKGCRIYVALFPCNMCAQIIIQSEISAVVYYTVKNAHRSETKAAKNLLDMAGIKYRQFIPKQSQVEIKFSLIEETSGSQPTLSSHRRPSEQEVSNVHSNTQSASEEKDCNSCDKANSSTTNPTSKRSTYLEWEEYFMSMAFLSAQRSKDPRTQVGAVIVNRQKKIVGIGYNGMPIGCSDDDMPWNRADDSTETSWLDSKSPYVCHAELNAVLNKNTADIKDCIIYVALFPCNKCAQVVIQSGIKEVVYYSDKYHDKPEFCASRHMLTLAGVKYRQFRPQQDKITIDFKVFGSAEEVVETLGKVDSSASLKDDKEVISQEEPQVGTNNNNIGKKISSDSLESQSLGNLNHHDLHNLTGNGHATRVEQESGWMIEVQELRFALFSFIVAGVVVFLSWHAGKVSSGQTDYL